MRFADPGRERWAAPVTASREPVGAGRRRSVRAVSHVSVPAAMSADVVAASSPTATRIRRNDTLPPTPPRVPSVAAGRIQRAVIPAAVTGLPADVDTRHYGAFDSAVQQVTERARLLEMQRIINAEYRISPRTPATTFSHAVT